MRGAGGCECPRGEASMIQKIWRCSGSIQLNGGFLKAADPRRVRVEVSASLQVPAPGRPEYAPEYGVVFRYWS